MIIGVLSLKVSCFLLAGPAVQAVFLQSPVGWGHISISVAHAVLCFLLIDKNRVAYQPLLFLSAQEY